MKGRAYKTILILEIVIAIIVAFICLYDLMNGKGVSNAMLPAIALILGGFFAVEQLIDKKKIKVYLALLITEIVTIVAVLSVLLYNFMNHNKIEGFIILVVGLTFVGLFAIKELIDMKKVLKS